LRSRGQELLKVGLHFLYAVIIGLFSAFEVGFLLKLRTLNLSLRTLLN